MVKGSDTRSGFHSKWASRTGDFGGLMQSSNGEKKTDWDTIVSEDYGSSIWIKVSCKHDLPCEHIGLSFT